MELSVIDDLAVYAQLLSQTGVVEKLVNSPTGA
jgi:hypothetical protein